MGNLENFDLDAGELCLDFANTMEWHASEQPIEQLKDFSDLVAWGKAAGIVSEGRANELQQLKYKGTEDAFAAHKRAIRLREVIYRIFSRLSLGEQVDSEDLVVLNESMSQALPHLRITSSSTGFSWDWEDASDSLDQIIWPITRSAAELLTSRRLDRVRQCADDRGCGYLFIDMSRNRSRRWCSMESCGNRAKASRHYKRQRENPKREI